MTDTTLAPEAEVFPTETAHLPPGLAHVEPAYRWGLRLRVLLGWVPLLVGALVIDTFIFEDLSFRGALSGVVGFLTVALAIVAPKRVWRRLGYALSERELRIVRGWLFHTDTIVPLVRVQHIDVARGPLDKLVGTASLIVHTAGTHNSVVTLPGLAPSRAEELRDTIRAKVKTDWQ